MLTFLYPILITTGGTKTQICHSQQSVLFHGQAIRFLSAIAASRDTSPHYITAMRYPNPQPIKITRNLQYITPLSVRLTNRFHLVPGLRMSGAMPSVPRVFMARRGTILPFLPFTCCTMFIQNTLLTNMNNQSLVRPSPGMASSDTALPTATKSSYSVVIEM